MKTFREFIPYVGIAFLSFYDWRLAIGITMLLAHISGEIARIQRKLGLED